MSGFFGDNATDGHGPAIIPATALAERIRFHWYRDGFRVLLRLLAGSLVLNLFLGYAAWHFYHYQAPPKYFATTRDGRLFPLTPLDQPFLSHADVLQWAVGAFVDANDYTFQNYRQALQAACNEHFTRDGCASYRDALKRTGNLEAIKERRLIVNGQVTEAPIVREHGTRNGRYYWKVQLIGIVTTESTAQRATQRQAVDLLIERAPTLTHQRGVAITSYIARPHNKG